MLDKASLKLGLDRAVLQSMSGNKESNVNGVREFNSQMPNNFVCGPCVVLPYNIPLVILHVDQLMTLMHYCVLYVTTDEV